MKIGKHCKFKVFPPETQLLNIYHHTIRYSLGLEVLNQRLCTFLKSLDLFFI